MRAALSDYALRANPTYWVQRAIFVELRLRLIRH